MVLICTLSTTLGSKLLETRGGLSQGDGCMGLSHLYRARFNGLQFCFLLVLLLLLLLLSSRLPQSWHCQDPPTKRQDFPNRPMSSSPVGGCSAGLDIRIPCATSDCRSVPILACDTCTESPSGKRETLEVMSRIGVTIRTFISRDTETMHLVNQDFLLFFLVVEH